jgi:hypothetical protein
MMRHKNSDPPFAFNVVANRTCMVCAPRTMSRRGIEEHARQWVGTRGKPWIAKTNANVCPQSPLRLHWFLVSPGYGS